jgi:hypothetical protein
MRSVRAAMARRREAGTGLDVGFREQLTFGAATRATAASLKRLADTLIRSPLATHNGHPICRMDRLEADILPSRKPSY